MTNYRFACVWLRTTNLRSPPILQVSGSKFSTDLLFWFANTARVRCVLTLPFHGIFISIKESNVRLQVCKAVRTRTNSHDGWHGNALCRSNAKQPSGTTAIASNRLWILCLIRWWSTVNMTSFNLRSPSSVLRRNKITGMREANILDKNERHGAHQPVTCVYSSFFPRWPSASYLIHYYTQDLSNILLPVHISQIPLFNIENTVLKQKEMFRTKAGKDAHFSGFVNM